MNTIIYLDMDGVIANFERQVEEIRGVPFHTLVEEQIYKTADTEGFFASIPPFEDMHTLLEGLFAYNCPVLILSATGERTPERVLREKNAWLDNHLKDYPFSGRHFTTKSREKAQYASHDKCVLIDDRLEKSIKPFREAGGSAIHHIDVTTTLTELEQLMKEIML